MSKPKVVKGIFRYPLAVVIWDDAHARNQAVEYTEDEIRNLHHPEQVLTLGLVLKEDATGVSLYTEETGPDAVRGAGFIPAAMIKEVIHLGCVKRPKVRLPSRRKGAATKGAVQVLLQQPVSPDEGAEPAEKRNSGGARPKAAMAGETEHEQPKAALQIQAPTE